MPNILNIHCKTPPRILLFGGMKFYIWKYISFDFSILCQYFGIFGVTMIHKSASNQKTSQDCKTLPREHLIGRQGVKMFLLKDPQVFSFIN